MIPFIVLIVIAASLVVVHRTLTELLPIQTPSYLSPLVMIALAVGLAWTLNYSVFAAFGQDLRAAWMHPVATGIALVAVSELVSSIVGGLSRRSGSPVEVGRSARIAA